MAYKNNDLLLKVGNLNKGIAFLNKKDGFVNSLIEHNAI